MGEKSHVSMEQKVCVVCCNKFDSGAILLETRIDRMAGGLRQSMERHTVTGWGMCPEHTKLKNEGYVALIGAANKSGSSIQPEDAVRTGDIIHVHSAAFEKIFNTPVPPKMVAFVEPDVVAYLKGLEADREGASDGAEV